MLRFTTGTVGTRGKAVHAVFVTGAKQGQTACGKAASATSGGTAAMVTCRSCRVALPSWSAELTPEELAPSQEQDNVAEQHAQALLMNSDVDMMSGCHVTEGCTRVAQHGGDCRIGSEQDASAEKLTTKFVEAGDRRPRCGAERSGTSPCIRVAEECQGEHYDKLGRTWSDQDHIRPVRRCTATPPTGHALCVIPTTNFPVTETTPHEGGYVKHRDLYGREWEAADNLPDPARYAFSYPALLGDVVTEGHVRYCAEFGHGRRTINGEFAPLCPRCGEAALTKRQLHVQGPNGGVYVFQGLGGVGSCPVVYVSRAGDREPIINVDREHFEQAWRAVDGTGQPQPRLASATPIYLASTWEGDKGVRYLFLGMEQIDGKSMAWVSAPAGGQMRVTLAQLVQRFVAVRSAEETEDEVRWNQVWRSRYVSTGSQWFEVRVIQVLPYQVFVRSMETGRSSTVEKAMFVHLFRWTPEPGAENYGRAL